MMITLNLLSERTRKPASHALEQFHRSPLALALGIALIAVAGGLFAALQFYQGEVAQLTAHLQALDQQKLTVFRLKDSLTALRQQRQIYQQLQDDRSRWARSLNTIADLTPEGVWFTDLSLDPVRGLLIEGAAISESGEEMVRIGRFVQDLKTDRDFAASLRDIQIESIKRGQDGDIELVFFTITCTMASEEKG